MVTAMDTAQARACFADMPVAQQKWFWRWLADHVHDAPEFAGWPRESLDTLATLLRAEAGPWGPH